MLPGFEDDTHFDIVFNAAPVFTFDNETGFAAGVMSRTQLCGGGDQCRSRFGLQYQADAARSAAEHKNSKFFRTKEKLTLSFRHRRFRFEDALLWNLTIQVWT